MTISDELDLLSLDVGANLADRSVTLLLRTRGRDDVAMNNGIVGSVSMSVAAQVSAVRAIEGDTGGMGLGAAAAGAGGEMCEMIVTAAAIAAATKTSTGTPDARSLAGKPDGGDLVTIGGVAWSVVSAKSQVGSRLWRLVLTKLKSG